MADEDITRADQDELNRLKAEAGAEKRELDARIARARAEGKSNRELSRQVLPGGDRLLNRANNVLPRRLTAIRDRQKVLNRARAQNISVRESERIGQLARQRATKESAIINRIAEQRGISQAEAFRLSPRERRAAEQEFREERGTARPSELFTTSIEGRTFVGTKPFIEGKVSAFNRVQERRFLEREDLGLSVLPQSVAPASDLASTSLENPAVLGAFAPRTFQVTAPLSGAERSALAPGSTSKGGNNEFLVTPGIEQPVFIPEQERSPFRGIRERFRETKADVKAADSFLGKGFQAAEGASELISDAFINAPLALLPAAITKGTEELVVASLPGEERRIRTTENEFFDVDFRSALRAESLSPSRPGRTEPGFIGGVKAFPGVAADAVADFLQPLGGSVNVGGVKFGGDEEHFISAFQQERRKRGVSDDVLLRETEIATRLRRGTDAGKTISIIAAEGVGELAGVGVLGNLKRLAAPLPAKAATFKKVALPLAVGGGFEGGVSVAAETIGSGDFPTTRQISSGIIAGAITAPAIGGTGISLESAGGSATTRFFGRGIRQSVNLFEPQEIAGDAVIDAFRFSTRRNRRFRVPAPTLTRSTDQIIVSPGASRVSVQTSLSPFVTPRSRNPFTNFFSPVRSPSRSPSSSPFAVPVGSPVSSPVSTPVAAPVAVPVSSPVTTPVSVPFPTTVKTPVPSRTKTPVSVPFRTITPPGLFAPLFFPGAGGRSRSGVRVQSLARSRSTAFVPGLASLSLGLFGKPTRSIGGFSGAEVRPIPLFGEAPKKRGKAKKRKGKAKKRRGRKK